MNQIKTDNIRMKIGLHGFEFPDGKVSLLTLESLYGRKEGTFLLKKVTESHCVVLPSNSQTKALGIMRIAELNDLLAVMATLEAEEKNEAPSYAFKFKEDQVWKVSTVAISKDHLTKYFMKKKMKNQYG